MRELIQSQSPAAVNPWIVLGEGSEIVQFVFGSVLRFTYVVLVVVVVVVALVSKMAKLLIFQFIFFVFVFCGTET